MAQFRALLPEADAEYERHDSCPWVMYILHMPDHAGKLGLCLSTVLDFMLLVWKILRFCV